MALAPFTFSSQIHGLETHIEISGFVNETAKFPAVNVTPILRISLREVKGLNSVGTRAWCDFLATLKSASEVWLDQCPVLFVKAFNQVKGAILPNCIVQSLVVPYYSDASGEGTDVLYVLDQDFRKGGSFNIKSVMDSKGQPMEPDVVLNTYFGFLKNRE